MRIAKATEQDLYTTQDFLQTLDSLLDSRAFFSKEESWQDWDDDSKDKIKILKIRKELAADMETLEEYVDNEILLFHFIKFKFRQCEFNWRRVVSGACVLIDNCCSPEEDHLAYHPYINRCMNGQMLGADSNEFEMEEDDQ